MPGAPETLMDLGESDGRIRFSVYATDAATAVIAALKSSHLWGCGEPGHWQQHSASAWDRAEAQIRFIVGENQMAAARDIWEDVFECAWASENGGG